MKVVCGGKGLWLLPLTCLLKRLLDCRLAFGEALGLLQYLLVCLDQVTRPFGRRLGLSLCARLTRVCCQSRSSFLVLFPVKR